MDLNLSFPDGFEERPDVKPFALLRDRILPALASRRAAFGAMYAEVQGRPEIDPVLLAGLTILQMMERRPDRAAVEACLYDACWRLGLELPSDWKSFHPTTLVHFRARMAKHGCARIALEAGLDAMRGTGYLKGHRAVRIDSTHVLALVSAMSRLECVRETLRLALAFLSEFGGPSGWEPWHTRYDDPNPEDLRSASVARLRTTMDQAGTDARDVLAKADALGPAVAGAAPVALLRRVFGEQFESVEGGPAAQRKGTTAGAVKNPHDPDAVWSTKNPSGRKAGPATRRSYARPPRRSRGSAASRPGP